MTNDADITMPAFDGDAADQPQAPAHLPTQDAGPSMPAHLPAQEDAAPAHLPSQVEPEQTEPAHLPDPIVEPVQMPDPTPLVDAAARPSEAPQEADPEPSASPEAVTGAHLPESGDITMFMPTLDQAIEPTQADDADEDEAIEDTTTYDEQEPVDPIAPATPLPGPDDTAPTAPVDPEEEVAETSDQGPANAPGREGVPVEGRVGADATTGQSTALAWGGRSDIGLVRGHNEDSFLINAPLFCVCDGMGGHAAGEVASAIAVRAIDSHAPISADDTLLGAAIEAANTAIMEAAARGDGKPGMGCTATACIFEGTHMAVAHVGDSRAYLLHAGTLVRVTHDHSYVEELVDSGEITADEARIHPSRSIITRALGSDPDMYADHFTLDVEVGDRIILCSDGLSSMITDAEIESVAVSSATPQQAADNLVAEALGAGGHDNVTVLVIDVVNDGREDEHRVLARRMLLRWGIVGAAILAVVALLSALFVSNSYYIGVTRGNVGIYRGVNANLLGFNLYSLVEETSIDINELPNATQKHLEEGISMPSLAAAESTVDSYRSQIADEKSRASASAQDAQSSGASASTAPASAAAPATTRGAGV